jgi:F420-non-reducing hydrogenase iron-sulfur subunit
MGEDRVWLRWRSASEGGRFAETIHEIVEHVQKIGPNTLAQSWAI